MSSMAISQCVFPPILFIFLVPLLTLPSCLPPPPSSLLLPSPFSERFFLCVAVSHLGSESSSFFPSSHSAQPPDVVRIQDDNTRHTIMGLAQNVRSRTYSGGKMLIFEMADASGAIPFIAWNDAHDVFVDTVREGTSLRIAGVVAKTNPRKNCLEMKLYPDTRVELCAPISIEREYQTIADAKAQSAVTVHIKCIACNLSEDTEKTRTGEDMRRVLLVDESDQVNGLFIGKLLVDSISFANGAVLKLSGRMSPNQSGGSTLFINAFEEIEDAALTRVWENTEPPAKRVRSEPTVFQLVDVETAEVGAQGDFTAVIRNKLVPIPMERDRVKLTVTVVDQSMTACDVGVFVNKSVLVAAEVGDVVKFRGAISSYNTRSLTTNSLEVVENDELSSWWKGLDADAVKYISVDPRNA